MIPVLLPFALKFPTSPLGCHCFVCKSRGLFEVRMSGSWARFAGDVARAGGGGATLVSEQAAASDAATTVIRTEIEDLVMLILPRMRRGPAATGHRRRP